MNNFSFSLLYPSAEARRAHAAEQNRPTVSSETAISLGLLELIKLKNSSLCEYFTSDAAVIDYRAEIFSDMLSVKEVGAAVFSGSKIEKIYIEADQIPEGWASNWCGKSSAEIILGYGKES